MTTVITMPHNGSHLNAPWPLSSQCSMNPVITMYSALFITKLRGPCHHNVLCPFHHKSPWALSSQCSMPLSSKCSRTLVIIMLHANVIKMPHDTCHQNAPEFLSSQCSMALSSQRSEERRVGKECRSRWSPYH